jgi:putative transposase
LNGHIPTRAFGPAHEHCLNLEAFLADSEHRIRFAYTPKHCSWLNQIEIWFGILAKKALRHASFASIEDLRQRILQFVDYFNETMARAFCWTYKGRALKV